MSEKWAVGAMDCRNNGPSEQWAVGIMTWPLCLHALFLYVIFVVSVLKAVACCFIYRLKKNLTLTFDYKSKLPCDHHNDAPSPNAKYKTKTNKTKNENKNSTQKQNQTKIKTKNSMQKQNQTKNDKTKCGRSFQKGFLFKGIQ